MKTISQIGTNNTSIEYIDRPTVKVLIQKGGDILILNDGLLPGGGIDNDETDTEAIERELAEEIGVSVGGIESIGIVIQYRDFLKRKYIIRGFTAEFIAFDKDKNPQDDGEIQFSYKWLDKNAALRLIENSISLYDGINIENDLRQGKLFNLKTSRELLLALK